VTNLLPERWHPLTQLSYFLRNFLSRFHTVCSDKFGSENVRSKTRVHRWRSAFGAVSKTC